MPGMKTEWSESDVSQFRRAGRDVYLTIANADDILVNSVMFKDGMVIFSTAMDETHILPIDRPMSVAVRNREDGVESVVQKMSDDLDTSGDTGRVPLDKLGITI